MILALFSCWSPQPDVVVERSSVVIAGQSRPAPVDFSMDFNDTSRDLYVHFHDVEAPLPVAVRPDAPLFTVAMVGNALRSKPLLIDGVVVRYTHPGESMSADEPPFTCWHLSLDVDRGVARAFRSRNRGSANAMVSYRLRLPDGGCTFTLAEVPWLLETIPQRCADVSVYGDTTWSVARPWLQQIPDAQLMFDPSLLRELPVLPSCEEARLPVSLDLREDPMFGF